MRLTKPLAAAAALSLAATPVVAAPGNPAAKLSLAGSAASSVQSDTPATSRTANRNGLLIGGLVVVAVVVAALALGGGDKDRDSTPASS